MQDADQIVADCTDLLAHHASEAAKAREVIVKGMLAGQPLPLNRRQHSVEPILD
jgi:heterodisulfide reductase subunit D